MSDLPAFKDDLLLITALTHRSALNEKLSQAKESNERLEFLGDAVLELITTEFLYKTMPDMPEGRLTAFRSSLVKTTTLAEVGRALDLGNKLYMSKGEESTGGRDNESLIANALEALIGALYLDQGIEAVKDFLDKHLLFKLDIILKEKSYKDPKSSLQEEVQALGFDAPHYEVLEEVGPDHDKSFTMAVRVGDIQSGVGEGKSKQLAQQEAARQALEQQLYKSS
ncbi:MAG: ribonuclease III [Pseudomonadales bacterium]|jgi:ribonuclease-3|nr:ribonuclease III [Pseudomonadales bacterium]